MTDTVAGREALGPLHMMLFAFTAGAVAANLYYVQPLLAAMAASFGRSTTSAGYLVTFTQIGYALGVFFLVPLGDVLDRRRLLTTVLLVNVVALAGAALSPTYAAFAASSVLVGITSCAIMIVVPYVAFHAPEAVRGRLVGQVMTGLLLGILLARTVSGLIGQWAGWRAVYWIAAVVVALLLVALRAAIVREAPRGRLRYHVLMASLFELYGKEPELRRRTAYALLGFACFSALWTGLTFLLSGPPYNYSEAIIGLFGLIGASGAISASVAGRLGDRGHAGALTGIFSALILASWALLATGTFSLAGLIAGIILIDIGLMGIQVTHQSVIYRLAPAARSRITAIFITACFIGGSAGSALASASYALAGWTGLCAATAILPVIMLAIWLFSPSPTGPASA